MKNKYYQPKIEEFHVGFEYEIYEDFDYYTEKTWHKQFYGKNGTNHENMDYVHENYLDKIRVKYLDQQDIENLGWEHYGKAVCNWYKKEGMFDDGFASYGKWTKLKLLHCSNSRIKILAYEHSWGEIETVLFAGECKNKSELKKLMQQLNIL